MKITINKRVEKIIFKVFLFLIFKVFLFLIIIQLNVFTMIEIDCKYIWKIRISRIEKRLNVNYHYTSSYHFERESK